MRNKQTLLWFVIFVILSISVSSSYAQSPIPVPISTPVHGKYVFIGDQINDPVGASFGLLDTFTGNWEMLLPRSDEFKSDPLWDTTGQYVAYSLHLNPFAILDTATGNVLTIQDDPGRIQIYIPRGWSADGTKLLSRSLELDNGRHDRLEIRDLTTNEVTTLFDFREGDPVDGVLPIPPNFTNVTFFALNDAAWNPVYPEWIAFQATLSGENPVTQEQGFVIATLYNHVTGAFLPLDPLLNHRVTSMAQGWSSDGTQLALLTDGGTSVIKLVNADNQWQLQLVASEVETQGQVISDWLGVHDLFLAGRFEEEDRVQYIAQIIDGEWYSTEFFRFPGDTFAISGGYAWQITADETEKRELSCIFDQTLAARLQVGGQGRVTFTDGTPSRLRAAPGVDASEITQMAEGTEFDVILEPECVDGYRWWKLRLDNGTEGFAAEADQDTYFLEPLAEETPTAVPTTAVPPTAVPTTAVPPTPVPPTVTPITPTAVPTTAVPPTMTPTPSTISLCGRATIGRDWIVFASVRGSDTKTKIYVMPPQANATPFLVTLETGNDDFSYRRPSWSPDRTMIAFSSDRGGDHVDMDIWVMYLDDCSYKQVTANSAFEGRSSWSSTGSYLAYASDVSGNMDIWRVTVPSTKSGSFTGTMQLTTDAATDNHPSWSPTTNEIAFVSNRSGNNDIYVMDGSGNNERSIITNASYNDIDPDWSHDGQYIAFTTNRGTSGNNEIYRAQVVYNQAHTFADSTSNLYRLTTNPSTDEFVAWSPDSSELVFVSDRDGGDRDLFIMSNATTSSPSTVNITADNTTADNDPDW